MNDAMTNKEKLLGLTRITPPAELVGLAGRTAAQYNQALEASLDDPKAFWQSRLESLRGGEGPLFECFLGQDLDDKAPVAKVMGRDGVREISAEDLRKVGRSLAAACLARKLEPGTKVLLSAPMDHRMLLGVMACVGNGLVVLPVPSTADEARLRQISEQAGCVAQVVVAGTEPPQVLPVVKADASTDEGGDFPFPLRAPAGAPSFLFADAGRQIYGIPGRGLLLQAVSAFEEILGGGRLGELWIVNRGRVVSFVAAALGSMASGKVVGFVEQDQGEDPETVREAVLRAEARAVLMDTPLLDSLWSTEREPGEGVQGPKLVMVEGESVPPARLAAVSGSVFGGSHAVQVLSRSEVGGFVAGPDPLAVSVRPASVYKPVPGVPLSVTDHKGDSCPPGMGGFLSLCAPVPGLALNLVDGTFPMALEVKARMNAGGELWTMGEIHVERKVESATAPLELESFVAALDGVEQVAVVRFRDQMGVDRLRVFVQIEDPKDDSVLATIRQAAVERFGDIFGPDGFKAAKSLPRSRSGKLLRSVLRRVSAGEPLANEDVALIADPAVVEDLK